MYNSSPSHAFDVHIATEYKSIEIAILVQHFQFWIMRNKRLNKNYYESRTWSFQTLAEIAACFPYWSFKQVERLMEKMVKLKILIKGNFNRAKFDRTLWYAFANEEKFSISRFREMEIPDSGNGNPEIGTPIPDTKQDTKIKRESAARTYQKEFKENIKNLQLMKSEKPSVSGLQHNIEYQTTESELVKKNLNLTDEQNNSLQETNKFSKSYNEVYIERKLHVKTTETEHNDLLKKLGAIQLEKAYERLSTWKQDTYKSKWRKSDYASILRWVTTALKEDKTKELKENPPYPIPDTASQKKPKDNPEVQKRKEFISFLRDINGDLKSRIFGFDKGAEISSVERKKVEGGGTVPIKFNVVNWEQENFYETIKKSCEEFGLRYELQR